ncbi:MAG: hypothetical protein KHW91_05380 [Clostridiales bacterium]|nr:hypothetical protein [Clostridiales bacterium]
MKESRPKNVTSHRARRAAPTTTPIEFERERKEIIAIAEMLTDGDKIYYLLGTARCMLKLEAERHPPVT